MDNNRKDEEMNVRIINIKFGWDLIALVAVIAATVVAAIRV